MDWQPIETAPRDGTKFYGECGENLIFMFWHPELEVFCSSFRRMQMAEGYKINGKSYEDHSPVTHQPSRWMPAPSDDRPSEEIIREDRDAWPDHQANDPIRAASGEGK